jgi:FkbM family methyltransferase
MKRRALIIACLAVGLAGLAAASWTHSYLDRRYAYRMPGFPDAPSPSLRMELAQKYGWTRFYSQLGQDKWIIGVVFPGVKDGYFVDIGAADGELNSNSKALEELGWTGVAVEPFPTNWSSRRCLLFKEVVGSRMGDTVTFRVSGELSGIETTLGKHREATTNARTVMLTTTTIADVLARARAPRFIHYVSLDVEGAEYDVLQGFPFSSHAVGAFTIEHNQEEPKRSKIRALLESNGYRFVRQQLADDWYVRR